jgi:hypothetical protein
LTAYDDGNDSALYVGGGFGGAGGLASTHIAKYSCANDDDDSFPLTTTWTAPSPSADDEFGGATSIDGDTLVVGEHRNDDLEVAGGAVYVFERHLGGTDAWGLAKQIYASDTQSYDKFGVSVAVSGDTIAIGAYLDDDVVSDSGSVYLYERDAGGPGNWGEVQKITAALPGGSEHFGISVSLDGSRLVVGADRYDGVKSDGGAAYVFEKDAGGLGTWGQVKLLLPSDAGSFDRFGAAVAIAGSTVLVGSYKDNNDGGSDAGSAYVFEKGAGGADNWGEVAKLTASDGEEDDYFGISVAVEGTTAVVGGDAENPSTGSAYVFEKDGGGNWNEVRILTGSDTAAGDRFGVSVTMAGSTVVVGAPVGDAVGAAYVFGRDQGGADNWGEVAKLTAPAGWERHGYDLSLPVETRWRSVVSAGTAARTLFKPQRSPSGAGRAEA